MKIRILKWTVFIAVLLAWIGPACAQSSPPAGIRTITLETGEKVPDLNGEWDATTEFYGRYLNWGSARNIIKITQEGSTFTAIRLQDDEGASYVKRRKGSMFMQGEVDKDGFKTLFWVDSSARLLPCAGKLSPDLDLLKLDEGFFVRSTLKRR